MKDTGIKNESLTDKSDKTASMSSSEKKTRPVESVIVAPKPKKRWIIVCGGIILLVLAGLSGATLYSIINQPRSTASGQVLQHQTVANDGNKVVTQNEADISSVVDKVSPSVVSITTQSQTGSVFGTQEESGAGTGIIVGKDGYILTNRHVIEGANNVGVILADGTTYSNVQVLGTDPLNDVAFLKIPNVNNLPAAELGDSSSVRVGQEVIAIGNSLGQYQNTVTSGIVSGTGRPVSAQDGNSVENLTDLLQTDAAINPGNSGGPLLNLQGQVIGINTAIVQDAQGIGFSIPINATKGSLKGVLNGGPVQRAYLGVNYIPITPDVAQHYNLPVKAGAYVYSSSQSSVISGGPADRAGIKDKDIITQVGGIDVGNQGGVASLVGEYAPGDTVQVTVLRANQTLRLNVTLQAYQQASSSSN